MSLHTRTDAAIDQLLQHSTQLWRGAHMRGAHNPRANTLPSGHAALDAALPGGGWPVGALIELLPTQTGIGELQLSLPVLRALNEAKRQIVFVRPPHTPYPPALLRARLSLQHIVLIDVSSDADARWAAEQTLRAGAAGAVLLWSDSVDDRHLRRLQLAAETGQALAFLYRTPAVLRQSSPAALRIVLEPQGQTLRAHIVKARGGHACVAHVDLAHHGSDAVVRHRLPLEKNPDNGPA